MSGPRALAAVSLRNEIASTLHWTRSDAALRRQYGFELAWRSGIACFTARRPLFGDELTFGHKAIGLGVLAPATPALLDRVIRYYAKRQAPCRVLVLDGATPLATVRLLERRGFAPEKRVFDQHVLMARDAPRHAVPGIVVRRARREEAALLSATARAGFGDRGRIRSYFDRTLVRLLTDHPRAAAGFLAWEGGRPAGTGVIIIAAGAAGLYSGSVLRRHRGRGIQKAVVAARIAHGLARGVRVFLSQTEPDGPSAHNLADLGFRRRWSNVHYRRAV